MGVSTVKSKVGLDLDERLDWQLSLTGFLRFLFTLSIWPDLGFTKFNIRPL